MHEFCDLRFSHCPNRLKDFDAAHHVSAEGQVSWGQVGSYGSMMAEGKMRKLLHRASGIWVNLDDDMCFDASWHIDHNWCDTKAKLVKNKRKLPVLDSFPKESGLCKDMLSWTGQEPKSL